MKFYTVVIFTSVCYSVYSHDKGNPENYHRFKRNIVFPDPTTRNVLRAKREAVGTLNIVTNNAQPIHADVKSDQDGTGVTEKPCPEQIYPSKIEPGNVFQVTAPKETSFVGKSLRKSWPLTNRLDLVRSLTRVVTLAVLVLSAAVEFYPLIRHLYYLYYV